MNNTRILDYSSDDSDVEIEQIIWGEKKKNVSKCITIGKLSLFSRKNVFLNCYLLVYRYVRVYNSQGYTRCVPFAKL